MGRIDVSKLEFLKIEIRGKAVFEKFWVIDNGVKKLVKVSENNDQDIMEYLTSIILKKLNISCVNVELGIDNLSGKNCCLVTSFLNDEADVSYDIYDWTVVRDKDENKELDMCFKQVFDKYANLHMISNFEQIKKDYLRILFGKCITDNLDAKLENIGLIFNEKTKQYRLPPSYDNGLSFSSFKSIGSPHCCVGNQYFKISNIINYITDNYFECVEDIINNLKNLPEEMELELAKLEINLDKKLYIINYIRSIYEYIKIRKETKCK